jgi:mRNA interferase RelE/StbE
MANYKIEIKKSAAKEIGKLPRVVLKRILERIGALGEEPRPKGCKKLSADEKYRIRVGVYRVLYRIDDDKLVIFVVKAGHRKEIYREK